MFGGVRNNSNTTSDGYGLALASLARRNRDRWMQEGNEVTRIVVDSTELLIFDASSFSIRLKPFIL